VDFSLLSFANRTAATPSTAEYDLLLDAARFADQRGYTALWVPERHFHPFGGGYPNPALAAAALAVATDRIRLRAGSVVAPLHDPLTIVEDWSFVDNLSRGRVDLALAAGWNPDDFVLRPERYEQRREHTVDAVRAIRELWAGKPMPRTNGLHETIDIVTYPRPLQPTVNLWLACTSTPASFETAGANGLNVLTALLFQTVNELESNIRRYRDAAERAGLDPVQGHVTLMVHTHVGESDLEVRRLVREPFIAYLRSSIDLWQRDWPELIRLDGRTDRLLGYAFERFHRTAALFGTVQHCVDFVRRLSDAGVDEVAALIDFGLPAADTLRGLSYLDQVRAAVNS
jgi:natural product biosynthesis luciferase-like monooxygenase protein